MQVLVHFRLRRIAIHVLRKHAVIRHPVPYTTTCALAARLHANIAFLQTVLDERSIMASPGKRPSEKTVKEIGHVLRQQI